MNDALERELNEVASLVNRDPEPLNRSILTPVDNGAAASGGPRPPTTAAEAAAARAPQQSWVAPKPWNVLGQNPPDRPSDHATPVSTALRELHARERRCPVGGCSFSWRGEMEKCRLFHLEEAERKRREAHRSGTGERAKKTTGVYANGPASPSMSPRKVPKWSVDVERRAAEESGAGAGSPGGLLYPSSPLQTGRYEPPPNPRLDGLIGEMSTEDHFAAEKQRLQMAALEFYRASGRLPVQPRIVKPRPEDKRVQEVLNGTYSPRREKADVGDHVLLSPTVKLSYSPQKHPYQSDAFYPSM